MRQRACRTRADRRLIAGRPVAESAVGALPAAWVIWRTLALPQELATRVVQEFQTEHAERYLLAFVDGWLGDHDLMAVRTMAEKYLMLGELNLVECVVFVG